ncbi:hypothetical protein EDF46_1262 [Frondihabitans sp. PhB188]|nr:hypothetical protein EDF46_1262 [Frondihabitans sp. PhB188]
MVVAGLVVGGIGVGTSASAVVPALSPSSAAASSGVHAKTEVLAYLAGDEPGVVISTPSTGSTRTILAGQTVLDPAISPDASQLAYTAPTPEGPAGLFVEPIDESSTPVLLVTLAAADSVAHPKWSPDGSKMVYTRIEADASRTEVVVDAATGAQLFATADAGTDAVLVGDNARLVSSVGGQLRFTLLSDGSTHPEYVDGSKPRIGPDGSSFSYLITNNAMWIGRYRDDSGPEHPGISDDEVAGASGVAGANEADASWSADGSVFYEIVDVVKSDPSKGRGIVEVQVGAKRTIRVAAASGSDPSELSAGATMRSSTATGDLFTPVTAARILDTRTAVGGHKGRVGAGRSVVLAVRGHVGIPADATAVTVQVTIVTPTASTTVSVTPGLQGADTHAGARSSKAANTTTEQTVALDSSGNIRLTNVLGTTDLVVDVEGYFASSHGYGFTPVTEDKDTARVGYSAVVKGTPGSFIPFSLTPPYSDLPSFGTSTIVAAQVTVMMESPKATTRLGISTRLPSASHPGTATTILSTRPGIRTSNTFIVPVTDSARRFWIYDSTDSSGVSVQVDGIFSADGTLGYIPTARTRVVDTRSSSGLISGGDRSIAFSVADRLGIPDRARVVIADISGVTPAVASGYEVGPAFSAGLYGAPLTHALSVPKGATATRDITIELGADGGISYRAEKTAAGGALVADVLGYYAE